MYVSHIILFPVSTDLIRVDEHNGEAEIVITSVRGLHSFKYNTATFYDQNGQPDVSSIASITA